MEQTTNRIAPGACPERSRGAPADESASSETSERSGAAPRSRSDPPEPEPADAAVPDFDPVPLRYRSDGLTPDKQREYVEALADTGLAREAAARIGVSEQAIARVRRRADARSFNLACEAAQRFTARRIRSIAYERAIEGTIRRHYYHGELKSEERVYDNKLLIYLLGKLDRLAEPPREAQMVADNWERWMEAVEQGLPEPPAPPPEPEFGVDEDGFDGSEVWESEDEWWTAFPPPAGFDGIEEGQPGGDGYRRTLSDRERAFIEENEAENEAEYLAAQAARRDLYFGFEGGLEGEDIFSPWEAETTETSAGARCAAEQRAGGRRPCERPADGSAKSNPIDVTGHWSRGGPSEEEARMKTPTGEAPG